MHAVLETRGLTRASPFHDVGEAEGKKSAPRTRIVAGAETDRGRFPALARGVARVAKPQAVARRLVPPVRGGLFAGAEEAEGIRAGRISTCA
jgi:hypothetical protein